MIIYRTIKATPEEYFDALVNLLVAEYRKNFSGGVNKNDIKEGFSIKKTYNEKGEEKVNELKVVKFNRPTIFRVEVYTPKGMQYTQHELRPVRNGYVEDTYEEGFKANTLGLTLKGFFGEEKTRRNMALLVKQISKEIEKKHKANKDA